MRELIEHQLMKRSFEVRLRVSYHYVLKLLVER